MKQTKSAGKSLSIVELRVSKRPLADKAEVFLEQLLHFVCEFRESICRLGRDLKTFGKISKWIPACAGMTVIVAVICLLFTSSAYAACTSPAGVEGEMVYNSTYKTMQFCDGTRWWPMKGGGGSGGGLADITGCVEGDVIYFDSGSGGIRCPDKIPDAFTATDQIDVATSTLTESNIFQITGLEAPSVVSIAGTGSPEFRICNDGTCSGAPAYGSAPSSVGNNQYFQLRLTSNVAITIMDSATITIGGVADQWNVTTGDDVPDAYSFTDQIDVVLSTVIESNIIQITGIAIASAVSIAGTGSPEFRVCNDGTCSGAPAYGSAPSTINNNQYFQLRLTSNATITTMNSATVTVGGVNDQWDVVTLSSPCPAVDAVCNGSIAAFAGSDCSQLQTNGVSTDGVYWIDPTGLSPFQVYCDMTTAGGGWTVLVSSANTVDNCLLISKVSAPNYSLTCSATQANVDSTTDNSQTSGVLVDMPFNFSTVYYTVDHFSSGGTGSGLGGLPSGSDRLPGLTSATCSSIDQTNNQVSLPTGTADDSKVHWITWSDNGNVCGGSGAYIHMSLIMVR